MRQAERRAQTRERLLEAAADVFGRLGFHAATVDDIADAAGYTKGAVYANFAGRTRCSSPCSTATSTASSPRSTGSWPPHRTPICVQACRTRQRNRCRRAAGSGC